MTFRTFALSAFCAASLLLSSSAWAQAVPKTDDVMELVQVGTSKYKAGDYSTAGQIFTKAYALQPDPTLLFNIARCYEREGNSKLALEKYEQFLKEAPSDHPGRERAAESVKTLKATPENPEPPSDQDRGDFDRGDFDRGDFDPSDFDLGSDSIDESSAPSEAPTNAEDQTPDSSSSQTDAAQPEDQPQQSQDQIGPWFAFGAGIAGVGAGTTLYLLGVKDHQKLEDARGYRDPSQVLRMTEKEARDLAEAGDSKKGVGAVTLVAGGALLVSSALWFLLTGNEGDTQASVSATPHSTSLQLSGVF